MELKHHERRTPCQFQKIQPPQVPGHCGKAQGSLVGDSHGACASSAGPELQEDGLGVGPARERCKPCGGVVWAKKALSVLQRVHEVFSGAGVAVLGVLRGPAGWTEKRAKALAEELGISFPLIHNEELWIALGVDTYSHLILVADRERRVRFRGRWDDPIICGLGTDCQHLMGYLCEHRVP